MHAQYLARIGVHHGFQHSGRLVQDAGADDVVHGQKGGLHVEAGIARFVLGHANAGEGRGGEHGIGDGPARRSGTSSVSQQVGRHDAVVVVGDVGELVLAAHVAEGPYVGHGGTQVIVGDDPAMIRQVHAGSLHVQAFQVGAPPDGHQHGIGRYAQRLPAALQHDECLFHVVFDGGHVRSQF